MKTLEFLWDRQKDYNRVIRKRGTKEEWTQTYLLGLVSEVDEVLREINWKKHRRESGRKVNLFNIGFELADLTKYIISLWQLWGFSQQDMLDFCSLKSKMLEVQRGQEDMTIFKGTRIVVTDLDGTICNLRGTFLRWLYSKGVEAPAGLDSLIPDHDLEIAYPEYVLLKEEFESEGGYASLAEYPGSVKFLNELAMLHNILLFATTARPLSKFKRIWMDTWKWIHSSGLMITNLSFNSSGRIVEVKKLISNGANVVMFEDDPEIIVRGANCGIRMFVRRHAYNSHISHPLVTFVDSYKELSIEDLFPKEK